jgi:hypothetical protein
MVPNASRAVIRVDPAFADGAGEVNLGLQSWLLCRRLNVNGLCDVAPRASVTRSRTEKS